MKSKEYQFEHTLTCAIVICSIRTRKKLSRTSKQYRAVSQRYRAYSHADISVILPDDAEHTQSKRPCPCVFLTLQKSNLDTRYRRQYVRFLIKKFHQLTRFYYNLYISTQEKSMSILTRSVYQCSNLAIQLLSYVTENVYMVVFPDFLLSTRMRDLMIISTYLFALYVGLRRTHLVLSVQHPSSIRLLLRKHRLQGHSLRRHRLQNHSYHDHYYCHQRRLSLHLRPRVATANLDSDMMVPLDVAGNYCGYNNTDSLSGGQVWKYVC